MWLARTRTHNLALFGDSAHFIGKISRNLRLLKHKKNYTLYNFLQSKYLIVFTRPGNKKVNPRRVYAVKRKKHSAFRYTLLQRNVEEFLPRKYALV